MSVDSWKIGPFATLTGVSVRTLHYYEEIGLLAPAERTPAGHRYYTRTELVRLQQIRSLQQLGLSLDDVRKALTDADYSPVDVLKRHIEHVTAQITMQQRLRNRLHRIAGQLNDDQDASIDDLVRAIQESDMMDTFEKYYTPEQLETLTERKAKLGEDSLQAAQENWTVLIERVHDALKSGVDPESDEARELARSWKGLIDQFTGGDPGIARAAGKLWQSEPDMSQQFNITPDVWAFIGRASARLN